MHIYPLLLSTLLIPHFTLIAAVVTCNRDFGRGINIRDCQQALSDLHAGMIHGDILHRDPVVRRFGRGSNRNYRDRLPKGFPWKSCALGLDIYGDNPKAQVSSAWKPMYDEIQKLMDQCVRYSGGIGGYTVQHGFRFVVASPHSSNVIGTCLANPQQDQDLGACILSRATVSAQGAQEARQAMQEQRARLREQAQQHRETEVSFSPQEIQALQGMLGEGGSSQAGPSNAGGGWLYNASALTHLGSGNASDPYGGLASGSGSQLGLFNASAERLEETDPGERPSGLLPPVGPSRHPPPPEHMTGPSLPDFAAIMRDVRHASDPATSGIVPVSPPSSTLLRISPLANTRIAPQSPPAQGTSWIQNGVWLQQGPGGPQGVWMFWQGIWQPLGRAQPAYTSQGTEERRYREWTGVIPENPMWVFTLVGGHQYPLVGGTPPEDADGKIWVAPGTPLESLNVARSQIRNRPPLTLR